MNTFKKYYTNKKIVTGTVLLATFILSLISLVVGSVKIPLAEVVKVLFRSGALEKSEHIVLFSRLPRTIAAILVGSSLAVSGVILQAVLNNSIASPNIIGINAGSGLFSLIAMVFYPTAFYLTPIFAFIGALFASLLVFYIGYKTGASKLTIVLSGVAISSFLSAFSDTIITFFPDAQISRTSFLIGGLNSLTIESIKFPIIYIFVGITLAIIFSYDLNVLSLGDETARSLALKINKIRFLYIALASLLAASAVSIAGLIGFIGLIIPHISRLIIGHDNRYLIPLSAILGSAFLLLCDMLARSLFAPFEIPTGIILSFLGAPFFIFLLLRQVKDGKGRSGLND